MNFLIESRHWICILSVRQTGLTYVDMRKKYVLDVMANLFVSIFPQIGMV